MPPLTESSLKTTGIERGPSDGKTMNNQKVIWTLIVATPLALAAAGLAYFYGGGDRLMPQGTVETAPASSDQTPGQAKTDTASLTEDAPREDASTQQQKAGASDEGEAAQDVPASGPSFDVVGVEPTGETVVAGRSVAGAIVALTANGKVVGKSIANEAGEWTIILEAPLQPGDYDVGLEVHDETGKSIEQSEQRLAVSIPEDGKEQPLVVLNAPDGPSDILQRPETATLTAEAPADSGETETTVRGTVSADAVETASKETTVAALPADAANDASTTEKTRSMTIGSSPENDGDSLEQTAESQGAGTAPATSAQAEATNLAATSGGTGALTEGNSAEGQESVVVAATDPTGSAASQTEGNAAGSQTGSATASTAAPETASSAEPASPQVTVEAVESEPDKVYVAGTGKPGSSVRVYVGEDYQGEAKVNPSGKWLVEGTKDLAEGDVEVRADLIAEDGSSVDARAAVTFAKAEDKQIVLTKVVATGAGSGQGSQGADVQKSLPVVIIRKGDNLWRISRRLYGDGVRYTTIYQANQDQIRDPDLIYPGQVFLTPEGDLNWPSSDGDTASNG